MVSVEGIDWMVLGPALAIVALLWLSFMSDGRSI